MAQPAEYHWQESKSGVFQRTMTPLERFFMLNLRFSVWASINLGSIANCSSKEKFIDRVRQAWSRILFEQPHLASVFNASEGTVTYTTATEESLDAWVKETLVISENPYKAEVSLSKPILCINPNSHEILVRIPHRYIDGIGAILLLKDLASHISSAKIPPFEFNTEGTNLTPVFDVAANIPPPSSSNLLQAKQMLMKFFTNQPSLGLPFHSGPSGQYSRSEIQLSAKDSATLVAACKARGLTPTHAVHTAQMQVIAELSQVENAKCYTSTQIHNWRSHVQPEFQRCRTSLFTGSLVMAIQDPGKKSFDDLSQEVKESYVSMQANDKMPEMYSSYFKALVPALSPHVDVGPKSSVPALSSFGVIEKFLPKVINGVKIENFQLGIDMRAPTVTVYLWNFDGRVTLSTSWDTGSFKEGEIDRFLQLIVEKLASSLGISISPKEGGNRGRVSVSTLFSVVEWFKKTCKNIWVAMRKVFGKRLRM